MLQDSYFFFANGTQPQPWTTDIVKGGHVRGITAHVILLLHHGWNCYLGSGVGLDTRGSVVCKKRVLCILDYIVIV
jgi:hypothetical protein